MLSAPRGPGTPHWRVPSPQARLDIAMPIYEYRCDQGHTFEAMQRMSDDPLVTCETCEAPVQRVFRPVAVHFKGSSFYNTDYGTRKPAREEEAHKSAEGSGGDSKGSDSKGSDSKSEKNSDSKPKPDSKAAAKSD